MRVANALLGDMGLTSEMHPKENCHSGQDECKGAPHGGAPEVDADTFVRMVIYSAAVGVPIRRAANDPEVLAGKVLFHKLKCAGCHTPSHVTEGTPLEEFSGLLIWPYTDLLLHDMGDGLADGRPVGFPIGVL